jgi:hypothetical protein
LRDSEVTAKRAILDTLMFRAAGSADPVHVECGPGGWRTVVECAGGCHLRR